MKLIRLETAKADAAICHILGLDPKTVKITVACEAEAIKVITFESPKGTLQISIPGGYTERLNVFHTEPPAPTFIVAYQHLGSQVTRSFESEEKANDFRRLLEREDNIEMSSIVTTKSDEDEVPF